MLTYNMDVESRSRWLRTTPGTAALAQPYYCTESGLFYARTHFATARTDKDSYLLFYTLEGSGLVEQSGTVVKLPAGSALLMDCRTPQSYCTAPGAPRWHHYWAHLDGAGVRALAGVLLPGGRLQPVELPLLEVRGTFENLLAGTRTESALAAVDNALAIHTLLAQMAHAALAAAQDGSTRQQMERAAATLRTRYAEELSLSNLLAEAHMGKSWFLQQFKKYIGTTPYNYLLHCRITNAKELLVLTDLPVGEIARKVGFGDESNFSTRFTALVGQSPLQYRKSSMQPA